MHVHPILIGANPDETFYLSTFDFDYRDYSDLSFLIYNGSPDTLGVTTSEYLLGLSVFSETQSKICAGRTFYSVISGNDDGSNNLSVRAFANPSAYYYYSASEPLNMIATGTAMSIDVSAGINTYIRKPSYDIIPDKYPRGNMGIALSRASGSATFNLQSFQFLPEPFLKATFNDTGSLATPDFLYDNETLTKIEAPSYETIADRMKVEGNMLEVHPNKFTALFIRSGRETYSTNPLDYTNVAPHITPLWAVA
jgi:hypothetical protein